MAKRWYYKDENGNKVPVPQYKINADDYYTKSMSDSRYYEKSATDTLLADKVSKSDIVQSTGTSETAVMSQNAVSDALSKKADLTNSKQTIRAGVTWTDDIYLGDETHKISFNNNGDLTYNNDKVMVGSTVSNEVSLVQNTGQSTTSVMSQKAVSDAINKLKNAGYLYAGIATPTTNPGTPDGPVFYIATTAGSYSNFGNIEISKGESAILKWNNGIWTKNTFKPMTDFNSVFNAEGRSLTDELDTLDSNISELDQYLYKRYNAKNIIDNSFQYYITGVIKKHLDYFIVEGIPVFGFENIKVSRTVDDVDNGMGIVFYNSNDEKLSGSTTCSEINVVVPDGAVYANLTIKKSVYNNIIIT